METRSSTIISLQKWAQVSVLYVWLYKLILKLILVESRLVDTAGEEEGGTNWEYHWRMYLTMYKTDS